MSHLVAPTEDTKSEVVLLLPTLVSSTDDMSTPEEMANHELTHLPSQPRCEHWNRGRRVDTRHPDLHGENYGEVLPTTEMNYFCDTDENDGSTALVADERDTASARKYPRRVPNAPARWPPGHTGYVTANQSWWPSEMQYGIHVQPVLHSRPIGSLCSCVVAVVDLGPRHAAWCNSRLHVPKDTRCTPNTKNQDGNLRTIYCSLLKNCRGPTPRAHEKRRDVVCVRGMGRSRHVIG